MSFLAAYIYDKVMAETEAACLQQWREGLLKNVTGNVLEIGSGTGANLPYYALDKVSLTLCEPEGAMRKQLEIKISDQKLKGIKVTTDGAEVIHAESNSFDYVVSTLVCCSVTDLQASLLEIRRVLKPEGKFIFMEHVAAETGSTRRTWQNLINPLWKRIAGNCHLNRDTESAIKQAGFSISSIEHESMRKAMALVRPTIRGVAVNPIE